MGKNSSYKRFAAAAAVILLIIGCRNELKKTDNDFRSEDSVSQLNDKKVSVLKPDSAVEVEPGEILEYGVCTNGSGQVPFKTKHLSAAEVKLFPRLKHRSALGITTLDGVYGINQFFMDHDLTSGFVESFTQNFFRKLPDEGYVLKLERSASRINQGMIYYVKKKDLDARDVLGQNLAFCRQWKLSEIDIAGNKVKMKRCTYMNGKYCPQVRPGCTNPYAPEIPIWSSFPSEGYVEISSLKSLADYDGGTAVIVWTTQANKTLFMDIHGSIEAILREAHVIKDKYQTDPTIGIYDAGTYARKFRADDNGTLSFNGVNKSTGIFESSGAGYGYIRQ